MLDIAKAAYERLAPGDSGFMKPDAGLDSLERFQSVHDAALALQEEGFIRIDKVHRENSSGRQLVDSIKFTRVK